MTRSHRTSTKDGYMWVDACKIDCDTLKYVSVVDGGDMDEEREWDDFSVNYDIIHWIDTTNDENWELEYDSDSRNLYIPQTRDGEFSPSRMNDRYSRQELWSGINVPRVNNGGWAYYLRMGYDAGGSHFDLSYGFWRFEGLPVRPVAK